jgi:hypothetical protein
MKKAEVLTKITRADVEWAIDQVRQQNWVPRRRNSTKYSLSYDGRDYPPKYLVMLAGKHATGEMLAPTDHSGGEHDSNKILRDLGFKRGIVRKPSTWPEV